MKTLIVNADDFGLTGGVCRGIVDALNSQVVRSTSAMLCTEEAITHLQRWRSRLAGRVGVHLQLTDGVPCSEPASIPTLTARNNRFPRSRAELGEVSPSEVRREWHAQMNRLISVNLEPTHIDTHHHVHKTPGIFEVYCEIALHYGVPARAGSQRIAAALREKHVLCADYCETGWWRGELTPETLLERVIGAFAKCGGAGVIELMCHPGYADDALQEKSSYVAEREEELKTLCGTELLEMLQRQGIKVVGQTVLRDMAR